MYRGLTANQQVAGDRYGRSAIGFAVSVAGSNNATSNGEYGGWFSHNGVAHPTFSRAKTDAIWRTGNGATAGSTASIQDIMQLLKQGQSPRPVIADVTRSGPNGFRLVGSRTNPSAAPGPHPVGLSGSMDPTSQASHGSQAEERHLQNGEHLATTNHLLTDGGGSPKRWPVGAPSELPTGDLANLSKGNGIPQRGLINHSSAAAATGAGAVGVHQRSMGSPFQSDQSRLMKSATTLGFASSDRAFDEQNNRNSSTSNFKTTPGPPNVPGSRNNNIYNAGPVPIWRNRWTQERPPQFRPGQSAARPGPATTGEAIYRPEPTGHLNTPGGGGGGGSNALGTGQFNPENGRSASWQTTGSADDVASAVLANRLRQDRMQFQPERVNSKLETVTAVDLRPTVAAAQQRPGQHPSESNAPRFGRYGSGSAFDNRNIHPSYPPRLVPEGFRNSEGSGIAPSNNGPMYSQLDHENKVAKSHLIPENSDESAARSLGCATVSSPRLGTSNPGLNAAPTRSILKKPKVRSTDYESGMNIKRRMDLYPMRHSAGSVGAFNGLSHANQAVSSGVNGFQNQRHDSNQKRVTFKLDK